MKTPKFLVVKAQLSGPLPVMLWLATSVLRCSLISGLHLQVRDAVCFIPESDTGIVWIWQLSLCAFVIFIVLYVLVVVGCVDV